MKRCAGIEFLNQCEYSVLCENWFGCKYEKECDFQRPKITAHNSDYAKCQHFATLPMFNEDTGLEEPLHICTSSGHFA